ncbi:MAG TPA: hypothetical protein VN636_10780, partial [Acidimicrobiia bacterium]|nr:hypothetical protein [Acidimicrobiia bacterium]
DLDIGDGSGARRDPPAALLVLAFLAIAVFVTFRDVSRLRTFIAGDSGDSLLELWVLRHVQISLPHGWNAFWNAPIFSPAQGTFAYSDTLLPAALVHWPLRTVFGDVLAFNMVYLGAWVVSSWGMYRLARRVVTHWGAAFVAALAYTYSAIRLVHQSHFQLVVGGALVPLVLLLLLRCLDAPSIGRGVALGVTFAAVTLIASYYGAMLALVVVIVACGWLWSRRPAALRAHVHALAAAAIVVFVLVAPAGVQYLRLQRDSAFRRGFSPATAVHPADFLATGVHNALLQHVPFIASRSVPQSRGIENRLFPGFVALAFGIAGAIVVARELRRRGWRTGRARELLLVAIAAGVLLVLAIGDWVHFGHQRIFMPFVVFRHLVPGFAGIRAVARLALAFELALCLFAAVGLDALLVHLRRNARALVVVGAAGLVIAESVIALTYVRVPTSASDGGVDTALRARPRGVVVELPISSSASGASWPFAEMPRQLLALRDHDPRVNGYSGFQPKNYDALAASLDAFPDPDALSTLRRLGVRYVILRTALVGELTPRVEVAQVGKDGAGRYDPATVARILAAIPPGTTRPPVTVPGGVLLDLAK